MFDDFLIRAVMAGLGLALAAGPLGCFVVWRRMAYFGDATAHAAILGVTLSLAVSMPVFWGVLLLAMAMALTISQLSNRGFATDTLLGVVAHSALAIGLVGVSYLHDVRLDLMAYLFGDILAVQKTDLITIWLGSVIVLLLLVSRWAKLLTTTLNEDLAYACGINPKTEQLILNCCLAVVVAVAIKIVGALLIAAMLIIPSTAARALSTTPERMAILAVLIGMFSAITGVVASYSQDTPTGPSIICAAALCFILSAAFGRLLRRRTYNKSTRPLLTSN